MSKHLEDIHGRLTESAERLTRVETGIEEIKRHLRINGYATATGAHPYRRDGEPEPHTYVRQTDASALAWLKEYRWHVAITVALALSCGVLAGITLGKDAVVAIAEAYLRSKGMQITLPK